MSEQQLFEEITLHLLEDEEPSIFLEKKSKEKDFSASQLNILNELKKTEQSKQHHPEGNVWIHTMMVVDEAAKIRDISKDPKAFMWGALLHDIGKPDTTRLRKGKITAYDHDKVGAKKAEDLLNRMGVEEDFINKVVALVRWHMQILFVSKNMAFADVKEMQKQTDIEEVALLGQCDRLGRLHVNREEVMEDIQNFLDKIKKNSRDR